jgi:CheY-like chemotaxis protein
MRAVEEIKNVNLSPRFSNPILRLTPDDKVVVNNSQAFLTLLQRNIREVLIVEGRDVFLELYVRSIETVFPNVSVSTARSAEHAMKLMNQRKLQLNDGQFPYDLVIVDYQLHSEYSAKSFEVENGSDVLNHIQGLKIDLPNRPLLVGTSMNLKEDGSKMVRCGADFIWGKPPPLMNQFLRVEILTALLDKRAGGHCNVAIV